MILPVTHDAASDARLIAQAAMSSTSPPALHGHLADELLANLVVRHHVCVGENSSKPG
jgi:hypothetical protein